MRAMGNARIIVARTTHRTSAAVNPTRQHTEWVARPAERSDEGQALPAIIADYEERRRSVPGGRDFEDVTPETAEWAS